MAGKILKDFVHESGFVVPEAFALVTFFATDQGAEKSVRQVWTVYASKEAYAEGRPPIGAKEYVTTGPEADLAVTHPELYNAVVGALTQVAMDTKDVFVDPADEKSAKISFLETAVDG